MSKRETEETKRDPQNENMSKLKQKQTQPLSFIRIFTRYDQQWKQILKIRKLI